MKKLTMNKETLRTLSKDESTQVDGGGPGHTYVRTCDYVCPYPPTYVCITSHCQTVTQRDR